MSSEKSIELTYEQIKRVMLKIGYKFLVIIWITIRAIFYRVIGVYKSIAGVLTRIFRLIIFSKLFFKKEETGIKSKYLENKQSMLKYTYDCVFFVAQKP